MLYNITFSLTNKLAGLKNCKLIDTQNTSKQIKSILKKPSQAHFYHTHHLCDKYEKSR